MTRRLLVTTMLFGLSVNDAWAQTTPAARPPLPDMQAVAAALGVTCDYCHAGRDAEPKLTASGKLDDANCDRLSKSSIAIDLRACARSCVRQHVNK